MKRYSLMFFVILVGAINTFGQTPTPVADNDVVKISTNLIQVDVTVVDAKGRVVNDLKPEEIEIYENGKKQSITNFSFISSITARTDKKAAAAKDPIPVPPHDLRPEQVRRTIALVVDDLRLSFQSANYTRKALKKFVDEQMQDGDLVAIIRTGESIGTLQQFTADKQMLLAAVDRVRWNPVGNNGAGVFDPSASANVPDRFVPAWVTVRAVRDVVDGMAGLPGRKSVLMFSDGFSLNEFRKEGVSLGGSVIDDVTKLIDGANRSSVTIYTVDSRGLAITTLVAADQIDSPDQIRPTITRRTVQLIDKQNGLSYIAHGTGGLDIKNNNDLSSGVRKILDDQSYYLVGYEPNPETFERGKVKFNKLDVVVTRPSTKVRYRSGFISLTNDEVADVTGPDNAPAQEFANALISPFGANGIAVRLNALFGNDQKIGTYVRSLLHIDAKALTFIDQPDGFKKAELAIRAVSFGDNGLPVDQLLRTYTINVRGKTYEKMMADGFVYDFAFPVKAPGPYQYRVAIRDMGSGKIGSASRFIDVPAVKKDSLMLSGLIIDSLTPEQWRQVSEPDAKAAWVNPITYTALRHIKAGTVLGYGFEVYGAKSDGSKRPNLQKRLRIFYDGKLILDGPPAPIETDGQTDPQRIKVAGAVSLGREMRPGDYILQVIVTDLAAKKKDQAAMQFVQFEVVD